MIKTQMIKTQWEDKPRWVKSRVSERGTIYYCSLCQTEWLQLSGRSKPKPHRYRSCARRLRFKLIDG